MRDPARVEIQPLIAAVLIALASACGGTDIGESCDDEGSTDECVDDAVCTNESGERAVCRELCEEHEDCPEAHGCNGVTGSSHKSCQPDDD
jgi:hypothetical protein